MKNVYVDGFVLVIPKDNIEAYKKLATDAGKLWMKHGALAYVETIGEDLTPDTQGMPMLAFTELTKLDPKKEVVVFSYITYKSRAHRDEVNAKVMKDMSGEECKDMPFDMKRMSFGGFESIVVY